MRPPAPEMAGQKLTALIFGALACNTVYYILAGRFSEALESVAWYVLLILFLLEITNQRLTNRPWARATMRIGRMAATFAIATTAVLYVREKEWLDAANLFLWIAVVMLLELEIRWPVNVAAYRTAFTATAVSLFVGLGCLVVVWVLIGKWMNAWDASLWLLAFGLLELNIMRAYRKT